MVGSHAAHDAVVGSHCVFANGAQLAGHAIVEDWATFGGLSGVAQHVRVGESAFVAAAAACERDVPPFVVVQGDRARVRGAERGRPPPARRRRGRASPRSGAPCASSGWRDCREPRPSRPSRPKPTPTCASSSPRSESPGHTRSKSETGEPQQAATPRKRKRGEGEQEGRKRLEAFRPISPSGAQLATDARDASRPARRAGPPEHSAASRLGGSPLGFGERPLPCATSALSSCPDRGCRRRRDRTRRPRRRRRRATGCFGSTFERRRMRSCASRNVGMRRAARWKYSSACLLIRFAS